MQSVSVFRSEQKVAWNFGIFIKLVMRKRFSLE